MPFLFSSIIVNLTLFADFSMPWMDGGDMFVLLVPLAGIIDVWLKQKYCACFVIVVFPIHTHYLWSLLLSLAGCGLLVVHDHSIHFL